MIQVVMVEQLLLLHGMIQGGIAKVETMLIIMRMIAILRVTLMLMEY